MSSERVDPRYERSRAAGLAAARAVLLEEGWEAVTQARIAERAGIGRATAYRHWPNRSTLLLELLDLEAASMHGELSGSLRDDLIGELERFAAIISQPGWNQVFAAFVHYTSIDPDIRKVMDRLTQANLNLIARAVEAAVLSGALTPDTNPEEATAELMGPVMYWFLIAGRPPPAGFIHSLVANFIRAHASEVVTTRRRTVRAPIR